MRTEEAPMQHSTDPHEGSGSFVRFARSFWWPCVIAALLFAVLSPTLNCVETNPAERPRVERFTLPEIPTATEPTPEPALEPKTNLEPTQPQDTNDAGPTDLADAGPQGPCTGIKPPYPDVNATTPPDIELPETLPETLTPEQICQYKPGQCIGSETPSWIAQDFQPQSCGFKQSYNLRAFRGYVTVVALLAGW